MPVTRLLYRIATGTASAMSPLLALGNSKLARGIRGRREALATMARWSHGPRDSARPTVWLHAPSVGEGLQARAVIEALLRERPDTQVVFTHFSPSAERLAAAMPVDVAAYLPWDTPSACRAALDLVRPDVLAFTKTEVWPVLAESAVEAGAAVAMVAGTLPAAAGRRAPAAQALLRPTWEDLALLCAVSDDDARGFEELGVARDRIVVTGDPGVDSAAARAGAADPAAAHLASFHDHPRPTLVAGSTWPADDRVLLPAISGLREVVPGLRVIVAPHEPDGPTTERLLVTLRSGGATVCTLTEVEQRADADVDAVVVDRVGVLAELYTVADVAYVGGGFHHAGLHSVLEPAATGVPSLFGPAHHNAGAAQDLLDVGAAAVVRDAADLVRTARKWLEDEAERDYAGRQAFGYIDGHRGAAVRSAELLIGLLNS